MPISELEPRLQPRQARSRTTMERILAVAAELVDEVGVEGFNTNLIAERSGLGVRTIYRYFPNKLAILHALAKALGEAEQVWVGNLRKLGADGDWRGAAESAIDGYFRTASAQPGFAALRAASIATPELKALARQANRELEDDLGEGLRNLGVELNERHMSALCRTIMEASNRVLDIALQSPSEEAELLVLELKRMVVALLEKHVG